MTHRDRNSSIAVVGVAALFPGSTTRDGFWRDIVAGRDLITEVPPTHWLIEDYYDPDPRARDKTYARRGAFIPEVDFDPVAWGVPPSNVPATDTTQLLALIVAQQVLEDACDGRFKDLPRERVSVVLGVTSAQELLGSMVSRLQRPIWARALRAQGLSEPAVGEACDRIASHYVEWQESTFPGVLGNVVAGRIANRLDLGGTNCVTDAACASSFSALAMAVGELRLGQSDLVICGGADTMNDIFMYVCFSKTPALSPTGDCRPFSDQADGTLLGEGIGMVALKRLADAERDNDRIYAVIAGVGASSDGRSKSVYAPVPAGQARALRRAYEMAGYRPDTVELVEAHGTGTKAGDAAEFAALRDVFAETGRPDRNWCALGSVKSQVGHTKAAAGAAGLFKAVMAVTHGVLPPTIKVVRPDPRLEIDDTPFYLNTAARPWFRDASHPRRAGVSSFGFGGSNFHVTVEEYTGPGRQALLVRPRGGEMVLLSAASPDDLALRCQEIASDTAGDGMLPFLARSTQEAFDAAAPARLGLFAESESDLETKLAKAIELLRLGRDFAMPGGVELSTHPVGGDVAFLFPGQGSQYLNMGGDLCLAYAEARRPWETAPIFGGGRLYDVVFPRPVFDDDEREGQRRRLTATEWAQPAIGAASLAQLELLRLAGLRPVAVAGHSFGELTALCAAGVLNAPDFLSAARRRGELMAEAARTPGAMISVSGHAADVQARVASWDLDVVVANYNSASQIVLSGTVEGIEEAERRLADLGSVMTRLPVATAFHSRIVAPACEPFRAFLDDIGFQAPDGIDVYGNTSAAPYPLEADAMRDVLARQIAEPVRFLDQIEAMYTRGVRIFVEVGPGNVLTNLVTHILKNRPHRAIALDRKGRPGLASFNEGLGQLSLAGVPLAYDRLWSRFAPVPDPRAKERAGMVLKIGGSGYGKPYPPPPGAASVSTSAPTHTSSHASAPAVTAAAPVAAPAPIAPAPSVVMAPAPSPALAPAPPAIAHAIDPAPAGASVEIAWVHAFQEAQRQTAESHAAFQRAMAETHASFLRSSEASLQALVGLLQGGTVQGGSVERPALALPRVEAGAYPVPLAPSPIPAADIQGPAAISHAPPPALVEPPPIAPAAAPVVSTGTISAEELQRVMLRVLAERTGYPEDMLNIDMDLEADLGVDSIKRVEILSAVQEQVPNLPAIRPAQIASKRTLREIVAFFEASRDPPPAGPGDGASPSRMAPPADTPPPDAETVAAANEMAAPLVRFVTRTVEAPPLGFALRGLLGPGSVIVTDDGAGVADVLAARLAQAGVRVHAGIRAGQPLDTSDVSAVIALDGLRPAADIHAAIAVNRAAFAAARAVAPRFSREGGAFVTVQDTGGDFGLGGSESAWVGGLAALARTAALEWPSAHVRALDVDRDGRSADAIAGAIWSELIAGGTEREVGLRADGGRVALVSQPAPIAPAREWPVAAGSVLVASGGARGITGECLVSIARAARCRLLVLGRTPLGDEPECCAGIDDEPGLTRALLEDRRRCGEDAQPADLRRAVARIRAVREVRRTLAAISDAGSDVRYDAVDVTDRSAVAAAVARGRASWGRIDGVLHGAGVLADKLLADKTDAQFDQVFGTKTLGLAALLNATRDDELSWLILFSSIAGRLGNRGQSDYAMANEVLNKVAALEQRRRGPGCVVRALGWGPWDGGMVDEGLRRHFADQHVPLIAVPSGVGQLRDEMAAGAHAHAEVVLVAGGRRDLAIAPPPEPAYDVLVDRARYPFLDAHRVKDAPVVPVALALEWFARLTRAHWPDAQILTLRRVQVLHGIRIADFDRGERASVRAHPVDGGADLALEIVDGSGRRCYSAIAERRPAGRREAQPLASPRRPWTGRLYGPDALFHGASLQVLRDVEIGADGLVASIVGMEDLGWPGAWLIDLAWHDGALQLALLWTRQRLGGASLPTSIDAVHLDLSRGPGGPVQCVLEHVDAKTASVSANAVFTDDRGHTLGELRGVVTHLLPEPVETVGVSISH